MVVVTHPGGGLLATQVILVGSEIVFVGTQVMLVGLEVVFVGSEVMLVSSEVGRRGDLDGCEGGGAAGGRTLPLPQLEVLLGGKGGDPRVLRVHGGVVRRVPPRLREGECLS